jgi:methyltransferase
MRILIEVMVAVASLAAVFAMMLAELKRSRRNERELRRHGAIEPEGDVYKAMAFAYPGIFVLMAAEGARFGPSANAILLAGVALFVAAKLLKLWAIAALGPRWSYRVLVLPGAALVTRGPYAHLRHPNYVAVFGEIAGFAIMVGARVTGVISVVVFAALVRRRIATEEMALKLAQGSMPQASGTAHGP